MSRSGEHVWQYGIRCDFPGCKATLWRVGGSEAMAWMATQQDAKQAGWRVARDRLYEPLPASERAKQMLGTDLCAEHARTEGMLW